LHEHSQAKTTRHFWPSDNLRIGHICDGTREGKFQRFGEEMDNSQIFVCREPIGDARFREMT